MAPESLIAVLQVSANPLNCVGARLYSVIPHGWVGVKYKYSDPMGKAHDVDLSNPTGFPPKGDSPSWGRTGVHTQL